MMYRCRSVAMVSLALVVGCGATDRRDTSRSSARPPARDDRAPEPDHSWRLTPPARSGSSTFTPPTASELRLTSGIGVIVVENHAFPLVGVRVIAPLGTADVPADKAGLAYVLGRMLADGTLTRDSSTPGRDLAVLGASLSPDVGLDGSFVTVETLVESLDPCSTCSPRCCVRRGSTARLAIARGDEHRVQRELCVARQPAPARDEGVHVFVPLVFAVFPSIRTAHHAHECDARCRTGLHRLDQERDAAFLGGSAERRWGGASATVSPVPDRKALHHERGHSRRVRRHRALRFAARQLDDRLAAIASVGVDDVQRAARTLLVEDRLIIAMVGPVAGLADQLVSRGLRVEKLDVDRPGPARQIGGSPGLAQRSPEMKSIAVPRSPSVGTNAIASTASLRPSQDQNVTTPATTC